MRLLMPHVIDKVGGSLIPPFDRALRIDLGPAGIVCHALCSLLRLRIRSHSYCWLPSAAAQGPAIVDSAFIRVVERTLLRPMRRGDCTALPFPPVIRHFQVA